MNTITKRDLFAMLERFPNDTPLAISIDGSLGSIESVDYLGGHPTKILCSHPFKSEADTLHKEIDGLQGECDDFERKIERLENDHASEVGKLETQIEQLQKQIKEAA